MTYTGGKLVIVNLQKTALDGLAHLRIFAKTDLLMELVMKELGITTETFEQSSACEEEKSRLVVEIQNKTQANGNQKMVQNQNMVQNSKNHSGQQGTREDKGGYIDPKRDCPHMADHINASTFTIGQARELFGAPCVDCGSTKENWVCNHCLQVSSTPLLISFALCLLNILFLLHFTKVHHKSPSLCYVGLLFTLHQRAHGDALSDARPHDFNFPK